jgi:hypothetical protein
MVMVRLNPDGTVAWSYTNDLTGVSAGVNAIIQLQVSKAGHLWAHGHTENAPLDFGVDSFAGGARYGFLLKLNAATGAPLNVYTYGNNTASGALVAAMSMSIMANDDLLVMGNCECLETFTQQASSSNPCRPHDSQSAADQAWLSEALPSRDSPNSLAHKATTVISPGSLPPATLGSGPRCLEETEMINATSS